jgi:putative DNA primase/helicase
MSGNLFRRENLPQPEAYYIGQGLTLKGAGIERKAICPFHDDHNPSMRVNLETGQYICYACGAGGDLVKFHMDRHSMTFPEAAKDLGAWAGNGQAHNSPDVIAARQKWDQEQAEAAKRRQEERDKAHAEGARTALALVKSSGPARPDHGYIEAKGITPTSTMREIDVQAATKILGYHPKAGDDPLQGRVLVIAVKVGDELTTAELIDERGLKSAVWRGNKTGGYWATQKLPDGDGEHTFLLGEGVATVTSAATCTGHIGVAALTHSNLSRVALMLRSKYPSARIVLLADLGIGEKSAEAAAAEVRGYLAVPPRINESGKDFNDLHQSEGPEVVKAAIEGARPVAAPKEEQQGDKNMNTNLARIEVHRPTEEASTDWPTPEKLPELPEVPPFDFEFLPGTLRSFVQDVSERMQAPPEFSAVGAMVMAGSAIGRNVGIRPKQADSWTVIPNLWGMIVGKSGIMKSPALSEALYPLKRMQALAFEKYEEEKEDYDLSERAAKIMAAQAETEARKKISKSAGSDSDKLRDVRERIKTEPLPEPKPRRYIINDSSPEALCETLKDNPQGVLCERDELIGLLRSMDREGNQEARALYLTAADGDKSFTVDRIMRGSGRHIEALCVSLVGGIQPGVLAAYVRETQRCGAGDDGLLQRFALMVYPDIKGDWQNIDRKPDTEARDAMRELIERLCTLTAEAAGAEVDPYGGVPFVRFDSEAYGLFVEWQTELERKLRYGDDHPSIASHLSKYRKLIPALALINHLCEDGKGPVSKEALARALLFSEFLEAHARRVYSYAARPDFDAAKTILGKLRSGKLPIEFTARDVYRPGWSGLTTAEEAQAAIRVLIDFKYIREKPMEPHEYGRPSTTYQAHPMTKGAQ